MVQLAIQSLLAWKLFCDIETGLETRPNKTESIKHLLEKYKLQPDEFYYIGDALICMGRLCKSSSGTEKQISTILKTAEAVTDK